MSAKSQVYDIPGEHTKECTTPSHAAATANEEVPVLVVPASAPEGFKIDGVDLYPGDDVTGANTNTTHLNLINRGTDGTGTTELANYDLTSGNNLTKAVKKALYAPATALSLAVNSVLVLQHENVGTGLLVQALRVVVRFRPA